MRPQFPEALNGLANLLATQLRFDEATERFEQAIALQPHYAEAHLNLARVFLTQCKLDGAMQRFKHVLDLVPDHAEAEGGMAACYLVQGDFERGWAAYEVAIRAEGHPSSPDLPRWRGEALAGRSLLVVTEQGLGDTIHFLRFVRLLKARGARVALAAPPALGPLLKGYPDLDELFLLGSGEPPPQADFYIHLHSIPGILKIDAATIPREVPYLWADPQLINHWRQELSRIEGFKIGIAWQGSRRYVGDRWRSMPLRQFAPLAQLDGVQLVSLQKGFGSEQIQAVDFPVLDLSDRLDETAGAFMDSAAVIQNLDLVVIANTALAHLAGLWRAGFSGARFLARLALAARPRRLALVSDRAIVSPDEARPVVGRFRAHRPGRRRAPVRGREQIAMTIPGQSPEGQAEFDALVARAQREHLAGRLSQAAAAYRKILTIRPDLAEVHSDLGTILAHQGQFDEAAVRFRQAIALKPELTLAHNNLASILADLGRHDEAVASFERVIELRSDYVEAYNHLAIALRSQGKFGEAAAKLEQAIALRPDYAEARCSLGDLLSRLGHLDQAAAQLKQAIALQPTYALAHYILGNVLALQDKLDEAEAVFRQAIALAPDFADAHNNLGSVLSKQERHEEAAAAVLRAGSAASISRSPHQSRQPAGEAKPVRRGQAANRASDRP